MAIPAGSEAACATSPAWSPDGRWLAYILVRMSHPDHSTPEGGTLALVRADGTGARILDGWPGAVVPGAFAWSPTADPLAVAPQSGGIWVADAGAWRRSSSWSASPGRSHRPPL